MQRLTNTLFLEEQYMRRCCIKEKVAAPLKSIYIEISTIQVATLAPFKVTIYNQVTVKEVFISASLYMIFQPSNFTCMIHVFDNT